ncbi:hypothetical protein [Caldithrix abyssi]
MTVLPRMFHSLVFLLLFELSLPAGGYAQFFTHLQFENGLSRFKNEKSYLLIRPRLELGQTVSENYIRFKWRASYQPEIFDLNASLFSQRFKGQFVLSGQIQKLAADIRFRTRYQHFQFSSAAYAWQSSDFSLNLVYRTSPSFSWKAMGMLWYRDTKDFDRQKLNAAVAQIGPGLIFQSFSLMALLYHERYVLHPVAGDTLRTTSGQRVGLSFSIDRKRDFLFSLNYKILLHFHQGLIKPLTDQQVNFLFGVWLGERWTFFLFVGYNRLPSASENLTSRLLYSPVNSANRFHLKLGHDVNHRIEIYLRLGYEQERLIRPADRWQYGQLVVGLKMKVR